MMEQIEEKEIFSVGRLEERFQIRAEKICIAKRFRNFGKLLVGIQGAILDDMVLSLHAFAAVQDFACADYDVTFHFPKSPWQFFKERYFPAWLTDRFPVQTQAVTKTVTLKASAVFQEKGRDLVEEIAAAGLGTVSLRTFRRPDRHQDIFGDLEP